MSLIQRIRDHALIHYNEDGWDILVESWTDANILTYVDEKDSFETAIVTLSDCLSILNDYRREIQSA